MKIKYQMDLTISGFREKPAKYTAQVGNLADLRYEISMYRHLDYLKNKKMKAYLDTFHTSNAPDSELVGISHTIQEKDKKLVLKTKKVQHDDSYSDTNLVYLVHVSLRKYCDSKSSWGLWQIINYAVDQKKSEGLDIFWSNFAFVCRLMLKKHPNLHELENEEILKIAATFKRVHQKEMQDDERVDSLTKDAEARALWYMLQGLYDGITHQELANILHEVSEGKFS